MKKKWLQLFFIFFLCARLIAYSSNYKVYDGDYSYDNDGQSERILFIMDYSNSMNETINGKRKLDMALSSMSAILSKLPASTQVGLRTYGHKNAVNPVSSCLASELKVGIDSNTRYKIEANLYSLKATGWTPITYSLKQAVRNDFAGFKGRKRIILLTDGGENCDESPCEWAIELMKQRDDIAIDVIAFAVDDKEADAQLKCAALVTKGKFYKANTYAKLLDSLENSFKVQKEVRGTVIVPK